MIDACGVEQFNEFLIINSGGGFNTADIQLSFDMNNNFTTAQNNDINIDIDNFPGPPCGLTTGNTAVIGGCTNVSAVGPGVDIPPNSIVILQASLGAANVYDFSSVCGAGQCVYVISSSCTRTAGGFTNAGTGTRETIFQIAGGCNQTMVYDRASLTLGANGDYFLPLSGTYGNDGCVAPPVSAAPLPPVINPIANVSTCGTYTLPAITGTNLSPNAAYYTGPNGTGTKYNPGDVISATTTLYAYDGVGNCSDQEQFTVTIIPEPTVNLPADLTVCSSQLVNIPLTGSAGATFPWTNSNTAIGLGASGTGNINFTSANVTAPETGLITITPTQGSCIGTPVSFSITVTPKPTVNNPGNQSVCGGNPVSVTFTGTGNNPVYTWTNSNPAIGLLASGSGDLNFTAATVTSTQTATINLTATDNGCASTPVTFTITVTPTPSITQPANTVACGGQPVTVNFSGSTGATFSWTNSNTAIGLGASGTGNISFTAANVATQQVATITVTPMQGSCAGTAATFTITINPSPAMDDPANQSVCAGAAVSVMFTGSGNPTYTWTNNNTAVGLGASGTGNINFTAANVANIQIATITVTPMENGCAGPAQTFTITVSPTPTINQPANTVVCGGQPANVNFSGSAGATFNWTNSNTAIGLPASGSGNISFTAANVTAQEVATITVTPMQGSCAGNAATFTITINPTPTVTDPADQTVCAGDAVSVMFTGTGSNPTYNWTNSNTAVGLGASGSGNISFTSANVANTQTATITVTATENGCTGPAQTVTITVNPTPTINQPTNTVACGGQPVNVNFSGSAGATFNWTNNNTAIGLGASGSGNISFTSTNGSTPEIATITVTPVQGSCTGTSVSFTITINPTPAMDDPMDQSVCAGSGVAVTFTGSGNNPTYNWTNNNTATGLGAAGSGNINFTAANVVSPQTGTITVSPTENGCTGPAQTFSVTVSPNPAVNQPVDIMACGGELVTAAFTGSPGAMFDWTNDNPAIGLPASGSGAISFTAANGPFTEQATITVTPTLGPCAGTPRTFIITINPSPTVDNPGDQFVCGGDQVNVVFTGSGNPTYTWTNTNTAIGLGSIGVGDINFTALPVVGQQTGTITVTPSENGCSGTAQTFFITVSSTPTVSQPGNVTICGGKSMLINLAATNGATLTWTNTNTAIGLPAIGTGNINLTAANVTTPQTGLITVTPTIGSCTGDPVSFSITVNPSPAMDAPADQSVCAGTVVTVNFTSTSNPTYSWTNSNPAIGLAVSGSGNISFASANTGTPQTGLITVTPMQNGCAGPAQTFSVSVSTGPVVDQPANFSVCNGESIVVNFTGTNGATFNWTNDNPLIGLPASGNGNLNFVTALVTGMETATIAVVPTLDSCIGDTVFFTITVSPGVSADDPGDQAACVGDSINVAFTGTGSPLFFWTNDNPLIGLPASGTGDLHFIAANVAAPETATITVTPQSGGQYAYIPNFITNTVSVLDLATQTIVATIPVGDSPFGVSVSPDGSRVYITNSIQMLGVPGSVSVIDAASNTVIATVPVGEIPNGVAVSPDGNRVYVANWTSGDISVLDAATNTVIATVPIGPAPRGVAVHPDGSKVYINSGTVFTGNVFVLDALTNTITATIGVGPLPFGICVHPDGSKVYSVNSGDNTVSVIDAATNTVIATVPVGNSPSGIAISPDDNWLYVTNENAQSVSVIDVLANAVTATIPAGTGPVGVNFSPDGNLAYVANEFSDDITVIDVGTSTVITTLPGFVGPISFGNFITPASTCTGAPQTFTITVSPTPTLTPPANVMVCSNATGNLPFITSPGATVQWTNSNPAIGLPASGTGNINFIAADVAAPQTATITATPVVGSCSGTPQTFMITVNPAAAGSISGDLLVCTGESTTLTASGGVSYEWDNGDTTVAITVSPTAPTTYVAVITNTFGCAIGASVFVDVSPAPVAGISGNTMLCAGQGTTLTATGGGSYAWSDGDNATSINVSPASTTTYTVTVTNAFSCTATAEATVAVNQSDVVNIVQTSCNPADTGTVVQNLQNQFGCDSTVTTVTTLLPSNSVNLTVFTCDPNGAGVFTQNLVNQFGCDSTVVTTIIFDPAAIDTTLLSATTCDPAQAGTTQTLLTGADGCDSLVITNTTLLPTDILLLTQTTCDPNLAGIFTQSLSNQFGCDSTVITTIIFDPAAIDTTLISATTCDPMQAGATQTLLSGTDGCDSLVITTTTLLPADTVLLSQSTCNPNQAGVFTQSLSNQFGCDSTVITTVLFDPALIDTTLISATTCDPAQAGPTQTLLSGADGCDSLVITNTSLLPTDTLLLNQTTCDPSQAGIFVQSLSNQFGCDSTIITTVALLPIDTLQVTLFTCDSSSTGVTTQVFSNQFGCDSTVVVTSIFDPALIDLTFLTEFTCDPAQAGTTQTMLTGADGCDSLVVLTTELLPSDTLTVTSFTCDPATAGTFVQVFQNQYGCDSVLISEVIFDPFPCAPAVAVGSTDVGCGGDRDGTLTIDIQNGQPPLRYDWSGGGGSGTGQIDDPTLPVTVGNLPAGTYTITITDLNNQATTVATVTISEPPVLTASASAILAYNNYATRCADSVDGTVDGSGSGGTPPLQFAWSTGANTPTLSNLAAGAYSLTVSDAKGCTALASALVTAPPPLSFLLNIDRPDCGDTLVDATILPASGVAPYQVTVDGNIISGTMPALGSGQHLIALTDANGCAIDSSVTLSLPPAPQLFLPADTSVVLGHPVRIEALTNLGAWEALSWQPLPDTSCASCFVQEWTPAQSEIITATITDTFGCNARATIRISVERVTELYVPNAFSPDGDGRHDIWQVNAGPSVAEIQEVRVFDRWGNLQYEWTNPLAPNEWPGWDGTTRGQKAEVGVYVYYMKVKLSDGTSEVTKGDVTVVRR